MFLLLPLLVLLLAVAIAHSLAKRAPRLPSAGAWGAPANRDPRVAAAGMMYAVASESGPVTTVKTEQMISLLATTAGLTPDEARTCLTSGKQLSRRLDGDLNSRLHQMRGPIDAICSPQEKQDVVDMLRTVAGRSAESVPSVREAVGRIAGSLLHG
jgi:uncharacterized tellurite resistance protein B-like protein